MNKEEVEIVDIISVLWKRRWLIIIGTLAFIIIAGTASFLIKPVYEISSLIQPGKLLVEDQYGRFEEVLIEGTKQVANRINEKTYDHIISEMMKLPIKEIPKIRAEDIKDTFLVKIYTRNHDIKKGLEVVRIIIDLIKKDLDDKVLSEINQIDISISDLENKIKSLELNISDKENEIKSKKLDIQLKEIEKAKINQELISINNKIKISEDRMKALLEEMKEVKVRIDKLEEEQRNALKITKDDKNAIGMLLYSNEIQNNLRYYNSLEERMSAEKINYENLNYSLKEKTEMIRQIDIEIKQLNTTIDMIRNNIERIKTDIETHRNEIKSLEAKKRRIDFTKIIKPAAPSVDPVFPKKKLNISIATILGLIIFSFVSFFLNYLEKKNKD